mgnify:CR=1 FL=1
MTSPASYPGLNLLDSDDATNNETEVTIFGFWVFLMSDLVMFGLFFATYVTMSDNLAHGPGPEQLFDLGNVAWQTACLLVSSFAMGMGGLALKYDGARSPRLLVWLGVAGVLAAAFLFLELRDFSHMAALGGVPSRSGFLSAYYSLVGLHGLHIAFGLLWLAFMVAKITMSTHDHPIQTQILRLALYWHFLGLVWIGIFSVVFLTGVA